MIKSLDNLGNGNTSTEVEANGTNLVLTTIHFLSTVMSHCLHKHPGNTHTHQGYERGRWFHSPAPPLLVCLRARCHSQRPPSPPEPGSPPRWHPGPASDAVRKRQNRELFITVRIQKRPGVISLVADRRKTFGLLQNVFQLKQFTVYSRNQMETEGSRTKPGGTCLN